MLVPTDGDGYDSRLVHAQSNDGVDYRLEGIEFDSIVNAIKFNGPLQEAKNIGLS